jgi:TPR repeat protein
MSQSNGKSARSSLRLSANTGDNAAQFELAENYAFDKPKNKRRAIYWYKKAAAQGHAEAPNFLGESYRDGDGVKRNSRWALYWFDKASVDTPEAKKAAKILRRSRK